MMHSLRRTLLLITLLGLVLSGTLINGPLAAPAAANAAAGPASLVKDINTGQNREYFGSLPDGFLTIGTTTYFTAQLDSTGNELWKTDRTANGTMLLKDIVPGPDSSLTSQLTNFNGTLFFVAGRPAGPSGLWKSNGTNSGTVLVKTVNPTLAGTWITDLRVFNGALYFLASSPVNSGTYDLWKSDGTANGTVLVKQVGASLAGLVAANGLLFMAAGDASTGVELWKSDGTTNGTVLVKDIVPGAVGSYPSDLTAVGNTLYFVAPNNGNGGLWKSDGTTNGTIPVELPPGIIKPTELAELNGALVFGARRYVDLGADVLGLWKSDGTTANTVLLKEVAPGYNSIFPPKYRFQSLNGALYFIAQESGTGVELWKSDGTPDGTALLKDICPGPNNSDPAYLTDVNGTIFFSASDCSSGYGQLWKTNGITAGTVLVKAISSSPFWGISSLANANGTLLFSGNDGNTGDELWTSDGSANGTVLFKDLDPDAGNSFERDPPSFASIGTTVFFTNNNTVGTQPALWKTNGTANGTVMLKTFTVSGSTVAPYDLTNVNGTLFFIAQEDATGRELWKSDGSANGTVLVKDIYPLYLTTQMTILGSKNSTVFFTANDGVNGLELWKSDGSANGTVMVKDIRTGPSDGTNSSAFWPTVLNGTIYFVANDGTHGDELWKSDGTANGTLMVKDINPGAGSGFDLYVWPLFTLPELNGQLFFTANDGTHGRELWKSDGSANGTVLVKDAVAGAAGLNPGAPVKLGTNVLFVTNFGPAPGELWRSDGTVAGTVRFKAPAGASFQYMAGPLTPLGASGKAALAAYDGAYGWELWQTDGTDVGTTLLQDIADGPASSAAQYFFAASDRLYFTADDITHGYELWMLPYAAVTPATPMVTLEGPQTQLVGTAVSFRAAVSPASVQAPVTYAWQASGQGTAQHTGALTDTIVFTWNVPGTQTITVTASNAGGVVGTDTITTTIVPPGDVTPEQGGSVDFAGATITFPPGAVSEPITLTYSAPAGPGHPLGGGDRLVRRFTLEAHTLSGQPVTQFLKPYTLVLGYDDATLAALGVAEAGLNVAFWNGSAWVDLLPCAGCGVDTVNNRVTIVLDHFTEFVLIGGAARWLYMPIARR
ncbi:MAG: ELWxxDGT repeat protein [Kouleothrix sp.]